MGNEADNDIGCVIDHGTINVIVMMKMIMRRIIVLMILKILKVFMISMLLTLIMILTIMEELNNDTTRLSELHPSHHVISLYPSKSFKLSKTIIPHDLDYSIINSNLSYIPMTPNTLYQPAYKSYKIL